jgi:flagellar biosynthesis protein FliQ
MEAKPSREIRVLNYGILVCAIITAIASVGIWVNASQSATNLQDFLAYIPYIIIVVLLLVFALSSRLRKLPRPIISEPKSEPKSPIKMTYDNEQKQYRSRLKAEVVTLRKELDNVCPPNIVIHRVWIEERASRIQQLIHNEPEHGLIQDFYTAYQERLSFVQNNSHIDGQFTILNAKAIAKYDIVMRDVDW